MLPTKNVYGPWPLSGNKQSFYFSRQSTHFQSPGEIDIVESRGNGIEYTAQYASSFETNQLSINDYTVALITFKVHWTGAQQLI